MDKIRKALADSVWKRAYEDTSEWSGKLYFLIADIVISAIVGFASSNPILGAVVFIGILLSGYLFFLERAPFRQRDELRVGLNTVVAQYQEHVSELQTKISSQNPEFEIQPLTVGTGVVAGTRIPYIDLTVSNVGGMPSVITALSCKLLNRDGSTLVMLPARFQGDQNGTISIANAVFKISDILESKFATTAIDVGHRVSGLALFSSHEPLNIGENQSTFDVYERIDICIYDIKNKMSCFQITEENLSSGRLQKWTHNPATTAQLSLDDE